MDVPVFTEAAVKKLLPKRKKASHKGENGRVLVVGGSSDYYGAPLLSALGAVRSGADLVYLAVPECNFEVTRQFCPELIVKKYVGDWLNLTSVDLILEMAEKVDVVLIGPGLGKNDETQAAVLALAERIASPLVIDAEALLPWRSYRSFASKKVVLTPHLGELQRLAGDAIKYDKLPENLQAFAQLYSVNILFKAPMALIVGADGKIARNETGNAGLTKGGTGDVLAGIVAGLLAQKMSAFSSMYLAAYALGRAGERLYQEKRFGYTASEVADEVAGVLASI